jgi:hypothetical protein
MLTPECWIIVDNVPNIGVRALIEQFQDYNPKNCLCLDGTACIEFFTKKEANEAIQGIRKKIFVNYCKHLFIDLLAKHHSVIASSKITCRTPRDIELKRLIPKYAIPFLIHYILNIFNLLNQRLFFVVNSKRLKKGN